MPSTGSRVLVNCQRARLRSGFWNSATSFFHSLVDRLPVELAFFWLFFFHPAGSRSGNPNEGKGGKSPFGRDFLMGLFLLALFFAGPLRLLAWKIRTWPDGRVGDARDRDPGRLRTSRSVRLFGEFGQAGEDRG